jgi:hypothetical protein
MIGPQNAASARKKQADVSFFAKNAKLTPFGVRIALNLIAVLG